LPYLVSPIDQGTGRVREAALGDLVDHLVSSGVHGLSPLGSTGEFAYLTFAQRLEVVRVVVRAAAGRVPVVPAVAAGGSDDAIGQAKALLDVGADAIVLIFHPYFAPSSDEPERFVERVANAVNCTIVLYSNPDLLRYEFGASVVVRLSQIDNVRYLKDASANTGGLLSLMSEVHGRLEIFSASAHIPLVVLRMGGVGWMSGPACLAPRLCVRLYELATRGEWGEAWLLQRRLLVLNALFQRSVFPACIKAGLELQGFEVGEPLHPQLPLSRDLLADLRRALEGVE
jgi:4-hydroxy-tetrahydrodipicolinate synthase